MSDISDILKKKSMQRVTLSHYESDLVDIG